MKNTIKWKLSSVAFVVASLLVSPLWANEEDNGRIEEEKEVPSKFGGSVSLAYDTNIYNKGDYRSVRNFSWSGSLSYRLNETYSAYLSSGGYRALENETGTFVTDSVIGLNYSNLFTFGDTGKVSLNGQFTIPTSESSKKDELNTALRLAIPMSLKAWGINFSLSPRIRKNFHEYKTVGGRSLTEWAYSLSSSASYTFTDLTLGISALGGNTISYKGTRRESITYGGSIYGAYKISDSFNFSLTAATSGFYADAERGTLGNIDLFDADRASYIAQVTYSF